MYLVILSCLLEGKALLLHVLKLDGGFFGRRICHFHNAEPEVENAAAVGVTWIKRKGFRRKPERRL